MRARIFMAAAAACVAGLAIVRLAPAAWLLDPWQGVLLGSALYMGVLHRRMTGNEWDARMTVGLLWRVAAFIGFVGFQAYAYFEWLPAADLRAPFVMLSGWIVAETALAPLEAAERVTGSSPLA